jgi:hypothetical protein
LIAQLEKHNAYDGSVFATLNYECLLEDSLRPRTIKYFDLMASSNNVAVCWKLHGSCTFVREQELIVEGVAFPIDGQFGGQLKVIRPEEVDGYCDKQMNRPSAFASPFAPSMAVFAPNKPFPFQPPQMMAMAKFWEHAASVADKIVVVGVNPNIADAHIWAPLATTPAELMAVGGPGDRTVWNRWADQCRPLRPFRYLGDGFNESIASIIDSI